MTKSLKNVKNKKCKLKDLDKQGDQRRFALIALFDCFQDHALAASESYAILSNSGYKWTDPDKVRWSSPTNPLVQDYQVSLMVELAELGFDEIVLQNWGYPDEGNLNWIRVGEAYDPNQLDQIVESFLAKARRALEPYGVKLSVMVSPAVLSGENLLSGQTGAAIDRWTDRVWVRPNSPEFRRLLRLDYNVLYLWKYALVKAS